MPNDEFELYDLRVEVVAPPGARVMCNAKVGDWFEVHGDYDSRSISVYALVENCRVLRRKLVYCSDNRTSMRTLAPCLSECLDLRPNDLKREAGNPLDGLVSSEGNICDHVGFGSLKHDDVASLSVRRVHRRLDFSRLGAPRGSRYEPLWWRHLL